METSILTPKGLFQKDIQYTVPAFQRRYVWRQDAQWEPLWEDVQNAAEDYLEKLAEAEGDGIKAEQKTARHFLGAVVVQQVNTATKDVERREVIDGQQRLTTLQLLLDAVQYVCETKRVKRASRRLARLVTNDDELAQTPDDRFKLWPTTNDREAFRHAMDNGLAVDGYEDSLIVEAHEYFQLQTEQWLGRSEESLETRAEALEIAVSGMLQMVVIDLGAQDDPHVIFETLNARGTPLLESDLIKNYVTALVGTSGAGEIWGDLDHNWWREDFRQGRLLRPRIDALLDYWLEKESADDVSAGQVFNVFKRICDKGSVDEIMSQVRFDLANYRRYAGGPRNPTENIFFYRTDIMQMGAFTPVLLNILSRPESERANALPALESFFVRRMVCRSTTKDYNRMALDLVGELSGDTGERADRVLVEFLSGQDADSRRWPTDEDVERALLTLPIYRLLTRGRLRMVLEGIEEVYRSEALAEEAEVPRRLSIEHVLPQSWEEYWPLPTGVDEHEARQNRNLLLHTIGNLTLVTGRLNSSVSNSPWGSKRQALSDHSVLFLNRVFLKETENSGWDEVAISARSRRMAGQVARKWPGPQSDRWGGIG